MFGMVRGTVFWILWSIIALLRLGLHSLRSLTRGGCWFAATAGDRIRATGP
jgi:hypothetical protein